MFYGKHDWSSAGLLLHHGEPSLSPHRDWKLSALQQRTYLPQHQRRRQIKKHFRLSPACTHCARQQVLMTEATELRDHPSFKLQKKGRRRNCDCDECRSSAVMLVIQNCQKPKQTSKKSPWCITVLAASPIRCFDLLDCGYTIHTFVFFPCVHQLALYFW